jgi:ribosomal protein L11 methyltransferase
MSSNKWWEIEINCHPILEETIFWRLENFGCKGMATHQQSEGLMIKAYISPRFKLIYPSCRLFWRSLSKMPGS